MTKALYQAHLTQKIKANNIKEQDDMETCWEKVKTTITNAAFEVDTRNESFGT